MQHMRRHERLQLRGMFYLGDHGQITWFKVTEYKEQGGIGKMQAVHAFVPDTAAQNETHAQA